MPVSLEPLLDSADCGAGELRALAASEPLTCCGFFRREAAEAAYRKWSGQLFDRDLRMGLLICNFLYFLVSVVFAAWSAHYKYPSQGPQSERLPWWDVAMALALTILFALSFSSLAASRPQWFSAAVLITTVAFVVVRAYFLTDFSVISPVVLAILIVCVLLGSTLLRMPFVSTLLVGLITLVTYGVLAIVELGLAHAPSGSGWYPVALAFVVGAAALAARQLEVTQRRLFLLHASAVAAGDGQFPRAEEDDDSPGAAGGSPVRRRAELRNPLLAPSAIGSINGNASPRSSVGSIEQSGGLFAPSPSSLSRISSAPGGMGRLDGDGRHAGAHEVRAALRDVAGELALSLQGTSHASNSIEAVHHALSELHTGSLREFLAREMLDRLPLPPWIMPAHAGNDPASPIRNQPPKRDSFVLVDASELPSWYTRYPYIDGGYRVHFTLRLCFASLLRLHNETLNVWSELLPAIGFGVWTAIFIERHDYISASDRAILLVGLAGSTIARPIASGLAHLLHCTSPSGYIFWWSVDYVSICVAILSSSIVSGHFAFYCMQPLQVLFFTSTAGLLSTSVVAVLAVASPALRATSFILFVLFCNGVPFCYQLGAKAFGGQYHTDVPWEYIYLWAGSLGTFALGLLIKSAMLPERAARSAWSDLFCNSHQLWHLCIHAAFVQGTFLAWDVYLQWRYTPQNACPAGPPPPPFPPSPPPATGFFGETA